MVGALTKADILCKAKFGLRIATVPPLESLDGKDAKKAPYSERVRLGATIKSMCAIRSLTRTA
jgi:hypothetical protein